MEAFTPQHDHLVAIDSDGCVFDTMELKHKECFIPEFIRHYRLQAVSRVARQTAEFVNLYSKHRGINRFGGLVLQLALLAERPEPAARGVSVEVPAALAAWVRDEKKLGEPALAAAVERTGDAALRQALEWSRAVNASIATTVAEVPPFRSVRESLERLSQHADLIVCSATPTAALQAEWAEHGLDRYVRAIYGQEAGNKREILRIAAQYAPGRTLMIGDAPGDRQAAHANGALFYPIHPGREDESWGLLLAEGIDRFFAGRFAGDFAQALDRAFDSALPDTPPWSDD
ncbi:MAG TPA: haloacid dehalogenase [Planctomycetaceae bacterium]|nr:haloacid dehalogenase [Planctomycetaceae bacterium]HRF01045.1 HAD hydrolase-like protein [Pirellulaceae bacterium]